MQTHIVPTEDIRWIHLIAVCGTGMGALACMLKDSGYTVTGSDQHVYPPMSEFLRTKGIELFEGFDPRHLADETDLVVVGNAVSKDNPEVRAMQQRGLAFCSMPQAINQFAAAGKKQIVIAGTHGKTTTSSFIAWMLQYAALDPSFLIGGILGNFSSNYRVGKGDWIVLEGDEYDTAFFDKGPKFLHYSPLMAVLTSVEFDHADIYVDLKHVQNAFGRMIEALSDDAKLLVFDGDRNIDSLLPQAQCEVIPYGHKHDSAWRLGEVRIEPPYTRFEVYQGNRRYAEFKTKMIGEHNLYNLLSGIGIGYALGLDAATIGGALDHFQGVRRRQEVRGVKRDIVVIDDFAHHPTAVKATLAAVKSFYSPRRIIAVFEPRTNSSRRNIFQASYAGSFDAADLICIRQPPLLEKIPPAQRFSSEQLVADLQKRGKDAFYFPDTDAILNYLAAQANPRDVILVMSNGGFDNIHSRLLNIL